jgi:hypothetical protein
MVSRYLIALCLLGGSAARAEGAADPPEKEAVPPPKGRVIPQLGACTLEVGGRTLKPLGAFPVRAEYPAGDLRVTIDGGTVRAFWGPGRKPAWTAKAPAGLRLAWSAADEGTIYLLGYDVDKKTESLRPESPARVRRLDRASGKWLEALPIGGKPGPKQSEGVTAVLPGGGRVLVLTATTDRDDRWEG